MKKTGWVHNIRDHKHIVFIQLWLPNDTPLPPDDNARGRYLHASHFYLTIIIMKSKVKTIPPMTAEENRLYDLDIMSLRTICNARKGLSCRDSRGNYLPKDALVRLIIMEPDHQPALPPPREIQRPAPSVMRSRPRRRSINGIPPPLPPPRKRRRKVGPTPSPSVMKSRLRRRSLNGMPPPLPPRNRRRRRTAERLDAGGYLVPVPLPPKAAWQ